MNCGAFLHFVSDCGFPRFGPSSVITGLVPVIPMD